MNEHGSQAMLSSMGVLILSVFLAVLGWLQDHTMMRHGLFAGATWVGGVFTMRMVNGIGVGDADAARIFNGWFAWLVISVLVAAWLTQWIVERRTRNGV